MDFFHGVRTNEIPTSVAAPVVSTCGIPFVVGTAPVHTVEGGKINEPVLLNSYAEAVSAFGYSDDWDKFTLCELFYSHFKLYGMGPVVCVNVLDPATHKEEVAGSAMELVNGQIKLPIAAIKSTVVVKDVETESAGSTTYTRDTDYALFYDGEALVLEVLADGTIPKSDEKLFVSYTSVNAAAITDASIIGGVDVEIKAVTGLELINQVYPRFGIVPDLILAPGWSSKPNVAAAMSAKAENINGLFTALALLDADTETVRHYSDVETWKEDNALTSKYEVVLWPKVKLGERTFHLSVQAAGLMAQIDKANGCPYESASNKSLKADSAVLSNGTEVIIGITEANMLNSGGIVTVSNFGGSHRLWGNYTACYPLDAEIKNVFIPVTRMFSWVAKSLVLTYWSKTDKPMTRRLIDSIVDSANIWLNSLVADEKLLGGRIEFQDAENPDEKLTSGIIKLHVYLTPPTPAQEINFVLEYDAAYAEAALA